MNLIVVGGGAAGMAAASKAKRQDPRAAVTVIERGKYVSYAECGIPYYLGGVVKDLNQLIHYPIEEFTVRRGIRIITNRNATKIEPENKVIVLDNGDKLAYDSLIIATGASPRVPEEFRDSGAIAIRSLEDAQAAKSALGMGNEVGIIGDGTLGMEIASELSASGKKVTLLSRHDRIFPRIYDDVGEKMREDFESRVNVIKGAEIRDIVKTGSRISVTTGQTRLEFDTVFLAVGVGPNSALGASAGLRLGSHGAIRVDERMETSEPGIFSAGDCATVRNLVTGGEDWMPLAQISNKSGRVAGANAAGGEMNFPGALGTVLVKIFDFEVGYTGITEKDADSFGINNKRIFVRAKSRAAYYPGGEDVYLSLLLQNGNRRILGAQVISKDGGAWRLNSLALAVQQKISADELFFTDFGYSPPFGPVWDPVVIAGSLGMDK
ncbi:MAG TPA: FAD-dependent oxidoreductase [Thermoplasmataceae archaeon]|nr:FAD-dependent oxidoreductase [Thermoplasmataceae archaeon]